MRPRLTKKVVRGLSALHAGLPIAAPSSDMGVAQAWVQDMVAHNATPRRKGAIPPQFLKRRRKRAA